MTHYCGVLRNYYIELLEKDGFIYY